MGEDAAGTAKVDGCGVALVATRSVICMGGFA